MLGARRDLTIPRYLLVRDTPDEDLIRSAARLLRMAGNNDNQDGRSNDIRELARIIQQSQKDQIPKIDVPLFDGNNTSGWAEKFEQLGSCCEWSNEKMLRMVKRYCKIQYKEEVEELVEDSLDWEKFKRKLLEKYQLSDQLLDLTDLRKVSRKSFGTTKQFLTEFERVARLVPDLPDKDRCLIFLDNFTEVEQLKLVTRMKERYDWPKIRENLLAGNFDQILYRLLKQQKENRERIQLGTDKDREVYKTLSDMKEMMTGMKEERLKLQVMMAKAKTGKRKGKEPVTEESSSESESEEEREPPRKLTKAERKALNQIRGGQGTSRKQGESSKNEGNGSGERQEYVCKYCDMKGHVIRFCHILAKDKKDHIVFTTIRGEVFDLEGNLIDQDIEGGMRKEVFRRMGRPLPATFRLASLEEASLFELEEIMASLEIGGCDEKELEEKKEDIAHRAREVTKKLGKCQDFIVQLCVNMEEVWSNLPNVFLVGGWGKEGQDRSAPAAASTPEATPMTRPMMMSRPVLKRGMPTVMVQTRKGRKTSQSQPAPGESSKEPQEKEPIQVEEGDDDEEDERLQAEDKLLAKQRAMERASEAEKTQIEEEEPRKKKNVYSIPNRADGLSRVDWDSTTDQAEDSVPVDGFLEGEESHLSINSYNYLADATTRHGKTIWNAPCFHHVRSELVIGEPFIEEDPWGERTSEQMMNLALSDEVELIKEPLTIEYGHEQADKTFRITGEMSFLVNSLIHEDRLKMMNEEAEGSEIREAFREGEYDGEYKLMGMWLNETLIGLVISVLAFCFAILYYVNELEQRPVAAPDASSSNTSDRLEALEMDVGSLKDGVQLQQTATQQLEQRICTAANHSSSEPCETAPKFDGQEIFSDSTKTDPISWFRKFELTLQLHYVKEHKHHAYLYSRSGGACQTWLDNLLSKYGVLAADLHTKISWDDLKAAWHKQFQIEPPKIKAMDKLMTQDTVNSTIARWMTFINQFDFFPDHIPGKSNHFADALSRRPDHCTGVYSTFEIDDDLRNNFIRGYQADPESRDKYTNCSSPNLAPSHYRIQEGYLLVHTRRKSLLCVPSDPHLRTRLLGEFHDAPATGHFGVNRTIGRLRERFWWPGLLGDVTRYCESCEVCRRCKSRNHRPYGELRPLPVLLRRREAIVIDITGPFPKHKTGVDGILTVVDRLTKFAMFLPCRYHAKAPELAEVLYAGWIRTKGYPKEIVCDRDTRFMSDFWLALIKRWGSSLKPSSTRHPQTDGQTERAHQTAQVLLRTLIRPDQKDWVERLSDVKLAYNSSIHPAIEISPFEFEHGSPVTSQLDTITPRTVESDDHLLFLRQMQELLVKARDQMAKTQQRMSQQPNRQRLPCPFHVGDLVWVFAVEFSLEQDISRKLLPKWMGPWPIVAPAVNAPEGPSFTIQVPAHLPVYPVFHCSKLALYTPAEHDDFPGRRSQDPPSMDGFQEVGDIISQRRCGNRPTKYLVHFAYCTHRADRCLTRAELQATAPYVLARYERKMQGKPVSSAPRRAHV
ncbi:hypothetical protein CBR_g59533 [Chara braunii]|uniref:Integrase catalytic domain-containing protein n=1 Tax=Chara braunii TaxID=69332 RepID=A0A388MEY7_CHABU|nr:hypothetical protein CBR_g59533 [Chara braunii]|eukprot:GBG93136.1 hypothetical protein CBR_g59533 [Chara braunii]